MSKPLMKERCCADCTQQAEIENWGPEQIFTNRQTKQFISTNPQYMKNPECLCVIHKGRLEKLQPTPTITFIEARLSKH